MTEYKTPILFMSGCFLRDCEDIPINDCLIEDIPINDILIKQTNDNPPCVCGKVSNRNIFIVSTKYDNIYMPSGHSRFCSINCLKSHVRSNYRFLEQFNILGLIDLKHRITY